MAGRGVAVNDAQEASKLALRLANHLSVRQPVLRSAQDESNDGAVEVRRDIRGKRAHHWPTLRSCPSQ